MKAKPKATRANHGLTHQLRESIHDRFTSAYALSQASGVSPRVIARFVSGERDIRMETADRLAKALGLRLVDAGSRRGKGKAAPRAVETPVVDAGTTETHES